MVKNFAISKKSTTFASLFKGEMAEWSIAAVLKTAVLRGTGGSNPSLSAKEQRRGSYITTSSLRLGARGTKSGTKILF